MKALNSFVGCIMLGMAISASAQSVDSVLFTLDTTPVRFWLGQHTTNDTVRGYIQNLASDSVPIGFEETHEPQSTINWVFLTLISGNTIFPGLQTIKIAPQVTLPVLIIILPYPGGVYDTESECFSLTSLHVSGAQEHCIPLYWQPPPANGVSRNEASSNQTAFYPNPLTSSSIIALTPEQTGRKFEVKIFDESGLDVTNKFAKRVFGDSISVSRINAPSGTYYYRLIETSSRPSSIIGTGNFVVQ